jgi:hypothetical protein
MAKVDRFAVEADRAAIRPVDPAEHLDHGALAGAVLAEQGVDLAPGAGEVGAAKREDPAEPFLDSGRFQQRHPPLPGAREGGG